MADILVPSPIPALTNPAWLYVPRVNLVLPVFGAAVVNYIVTEAGDNITTEDGNQFITEQ